MKSRYLLLASIVLASSSASLQAQPPVVATPGMTPTEEKLRFVSVEDLEAEVGEIPPIVLDAKEATLADVCAQLAKQTGFVFTVFESVRSRKVTVTAKTPTPFWKVFLEAINSSGASYNYTPQGKVFTLFPVIARDPSVTGHTGIGSATGGFYVLATKMTQTRGINFGGAALTATPDRTVSSRLDLQFYENPNARVTGRRVVALEKALDDTAKVLSLRGQTPFNTGIAGVSLDLGEIPATAKTLKLLRGIYQTNAVLKSEVWDVPDVLAARNVSKKVGNWTFTLSEVAVTNDQYEVRITMADDLQVTRNGFGGPRASPMREAINNVYREMQLLDANGKALNTRGSSVNFGEKMQMQMRFTRNDNNGNAAVGLPSKFSWELPTEVATVVVPFEFKDLPLP